MYLDQRARFTTSRWIALAAIFLLWTGCGDHTGKERVTGHVSFRGEPLTNASVMFYPISGRPETATIADGDYSAQLAPGDYTVQLNVGVDVPKGYKEGEPLPPPKFKLPEEYTNRTKSILKASVKQGQTDPIDFLLK
jgi:hypothetical protein